MQIIITILFYYGLKLEKGGAVLLLQLLSVYWTFSPTDTVCAPPLNHPVVMTVDDRCLYLDQTPAHNLIHTRAAACCFWEESCLSSQFGREHMVSTAVKTGVH